MSRCDHPMRRRLDLELGPSSRRERTGRSRSSLGKCLAEGPYGLAALKE